MADVLLVEDDADTSDAVSRYLQNSRHSVRTAVSGRDALAALLAATPDVIILDVRLPEMDGVMFLDIIRSYLRWQKLPVIVLTAYPDGPHIARLTALGVGKLFHKADYQLSDLLAAIDGQVQTDGRHPAARRSH